MSTRSMKATLFATTNPRKIIEANATLAAYNIAVESVALGIDEIQHKDPAEIVKAKAKAAYAVTRKPVVVSDTSWSIPALNGFPGGYMKDVSSWFTAEDWLTLMASHDDRTIECHEHLAYYDGGELQHFASVYTGSISTKATGSEADHESIDRVAMLYGNQTMAEMKDSGSVASAGEILEHWQQFGEWFSSL